jgi:hypothetical protein
VTYIGPAGYPADRLSFRSSPFHSIVGTFAALKWRIAEISDPTAPRYDPNAPKKYEIEATWESPEISPFAGDIQIPPCVAEPGRTYRVRCRIKNNLERWSNWSAPVEFSAGAPTGSGSNLRLRITEVMYHPPASGSEDGWDADDFEFVELMNVGLRPSILLVCVLWTGSSATSPHDAATTQRAGLVYRLPLCWEAMSSQIAGEYKGKLANGSETIKLIDTPTGVVAEFAYADDWYASADGAGRSLVLVNPGQVSPDQLGRKTSWRASYR